MLWVFLNSSSWGGASWRLGVLKGEDNARLLLQGALQQAQPRPTVKDAAISKDSSSLHLTCTSKYVLSTHKPAHGGSQKEQTRKWPLVTQLIGSY